jgi:hypothetical protein
MPESYGQEGAPPEKGEDLGNVSEKLLNPVSDLWSLQFQDNLKIMEGSLAQDDTHWQNVLNFQPVMPVPLGDNWNLVNRPVLPIVVTELPEPGIDHETKRPEFGFQTKGGLGDMAFLQLLSPAKLPHSLIAGLGWSWIFPTATDKLLGADKWQLGPTALAGYVGKKWVAIVIYQQWFSLGGGDPRKDQSSMSLQPIVQYRITPTFNVGMSPVILANWEADSENRWQVPVGFGFSHTIKIGKLPVKYGFELQYYLETPKAYGPEWNFVFTITPVIPNPFKLLKRD